jgi:hypothetical protein
VNGGSAEVGSEVLVMCGSFGLSVMTMRVGQRTYEIAQDIEGAEPPTPLKVVICLSCAPTPSISCAISYVR